MDITRYLGVPLLVYGAVEYGGIWIARYFSEGQTLLAGVPTHLETWMTEFVDNKLKPLEVFSLSLLIGGAVLVVISFLYRRN